MPVWRQFTYGLRTLLHRATRNRDLTDELEQYYEEATSEWMGRGLSAEDAKRRVCLDAGSLTAATDQASAYGWENRIAGFFHDLRFAARQRLKHPTFTAAATLTLT